jgi:hypothetical protein
MPIVRLTTLYHAYAEPTLNYPLSNLSTIACARNDRVVARTDQMNSLEKLFTDALKAVSS